ncbi:glycosyltransferase [Glutamicibacter ardleyensis]|uniref:glycosyltransferase n=1 Tax=Glutamicibacter ardleyensis TaxID=225894 RepID=UPI003FD3425F
MEEHALLTKSIKYRDVLATAVVGRGTTYDDLSENLDDLTNGEVDFAVLAALGRIVALQNITSEDRPNGRKFVHVANENLPRTKLFQKYRQLEFELIFESASYSEAVAYLNANPELKEVQDGYLEVDLYNPFSGSENSDYTRWLHGFNKIFESDGRWPVALSGDAKNPFDRLTAAKDLHQITDGPLVSVIMTSYEPEPEAFMAAARSILNQTWRNLELIIVDDASPNRADKLLEKLIEQDGRVKLVLLTENGGTYRARNVGLEVATGEFVTGQDSDDWSHPERLESQVKYLLEDPEAAGVMTSAVRTDENLSRIMPGLSPTRKCEVSFMAPLHLAREVGGYLNARKAADSEFRQRVEFYSQRDVGVIRDALYVIRLMPNSLSRGDFSSGWSHQSRRAFWNAALYWHSNTPASGLSVRDEPKAALPIPPRFQITKPSLRELDIVIAADWRMSHGWQRTAVDEVKFLVARGLQVGMMQMESPNANARTSAKPNLQIQELINSGTIAQVTSEQEVKIANLVLHDPSIMQFPTTQESNLRVGKIIMAPFDLPSDSNGEVIRYLYDDCTRNTQDYFSAEVEWSFLNNMSQAIGEAVDSGVSVLPRVWPLVLDLETWSGKNNLGNNSPRKIPILGRSCQDIDLHWPMKETIQQLWPTDDSAEVWILGDARGALRNLKEKYYADNWISFREGEIQPVDYMRAIDFFVYFPSEDSDENVCREAFEAAAAGKVVFLPEKFRNAHGDTALYTNPEGVAQLLEHYWRSKESYQAQARTARDALAQMFSDENDLEERFRSLLALA